MKILRNFWCAVLFATAIPAQAQVTLSNFTDQWWNPFESGWGLALFQQADVMFIDLFVYDTNGNPIWFTATATYQGQTGSGDLVFSGDLIQTTGSYFGGPVFTPGAVTRTKVGTITFDAVSATSAKLTYSVGGLTVVKTISRQLFKNQDISGSYYGGFIYNASGCVLPVLNGPTNQIASLLIGQAGTTVSIFESTVSGVTCNFGGAYTQDGHLATITGTFNCSNGDVGPFVLSEIEVTKGGISGQFTGQSQACTKLQGQFGGVRTTLN
jgi:hypothetical protein